MKRKTKNKTPSRPRRKPTQPSSRPARASAPGQEFSVTHALEQAGRPLPFDELALRVGAMTAAKRTKLNGQLERALHSGDIVKNRREEYCLRERLTLVVGTVAGHRDGHGFLHPDDRSTPVVLPYRQMREVMHGDRVAVRVSGTDQRGRPEGTVVEVLERGTTDIVGRLYDESGISYVVPDNPRIGHRVLVPRDRLENAKPGQVVLLKL